MGCSGKNPRIDRMTSEFEENQMSLPDIVFFKAEVEKSKSPDDSSISGNEIPLAESVETTYAFFTRLAQLGSGKESNKVSKTLRAEITSLEDILNRFDCIKVFMHVFRREMKTKYRLKDKKWGRWRLERVYVISHIVKNLIPHCMTRCYEQKCEIFSWSQCREPSWGIPWTLK